MLKEVAEGYGLCQNRNKIPWHDGNEKLEVKLQKQYGNHSIIYLEHSASMAAKLASRME